MYRMQRPCPKYTPNSKAPGTVFDGKAARALHRHGIASAGVRDDEIGGVAANFSAWLAGWCLVIDVISLRSSQLVLLVDRDSALALPDRGSG